VTENTGGLASSQADVHLAGTFTFLSAIWGPHRSHRQNHANTDSQSVGHDQMFVIVIALFSYETLSDEKAGHSFVAQYAVVSQSSVCR
jgi:hypothetical protein